MSQPLPWQWMALSQIKPADSNPKQHEDERIRGMLSRFGIAEWMVLDQRTGKLVAGHGRLEQLQRLAAAGQQPRGVRVDPDSGAWHVPVVLWHSEDDAQAATYVITDNELTRRGGNDTDLLLEVLSDLQEFDADLTSLVGYPPERIDKLLGGSDDHGKDDAGDEEPKKMMDPAVLITCLDEQEQQGSYERLVSLGYDVTVVNA